MPYPAQFAATDDESAELAGGGEGDVVLARVRVSLYPELVGPEEWMTSSEVT